MIHSLTDPPERKSFALFRNMKRRNYVDLCNEMAPVVSDNELEDLYEFCAMNGHLAAFEEVFCEDYSRSK